MKSKRIPRRIIQYIIGIALMAFGVVVLKRTMWGLSPISTMPDALANITPLSLGTWTWIVHVICIIIQIILQKRVTIKSLLCIAVAFAFGYLCDFFMFIWNPPLVLWSKIVSLIFGILCQGVGVAFIHGCDMILPAPDEMNSVISRLIGKKLGNIKTVTDLIYVAVAGIINLLTYFFARDLFSLSIGINSIACVLLTGRFVNLTLKLFPKLKMEPLFK